MAGRAIRVDLGYVPANHRHNYDLCHINDSKFAIFDERILELREDVSIHLPGINLILLKPITAVRNVKIHALNVICLNDIQSLQGRVDITAQSQVILLGCKIQGKEEGSIHGAVVAPRVDKDLFNTIHDVFREAIKAPNPQAQGQGIVHSLCEVYGVVNEHQNGREEGEEVEVPDALRYFAVDVRA